jgi:hypothetical protein
MVFSGITTLFFRNEYGNRIWWGKRKSVLFAILLTNNGHAVEKYAKTVAHNIDVYQPDVAVAGAAVATIHAIHV